MKKKERNQYTLAEKQEHVLKIETLVASGSTIKEACEKTGLADGLFHKWKRAGIKSAPAPSQSPSELPSSRSNPKFLTIEQKAKVIADATALIDSGMSVKDAIAKVGINQANFYAYKKQLGKLNGNLPAVAGPSKDLQMMQFDLGTEKKAPMVLMIGNAEDFKSTLASLGNLLRGN